MGLPRALTALLSVMLLGACSSGAADTAESGSPAATSTPTAATATASDTPTATEAATASPTTSAPRELASKATQLKRSTIPVLCYHQIRAWTGNDTDYAKSITVPPKTLAKQLTAIKKAGFHAISPQQQYEHIAYGDPLPKKPIVISFDDGWESEWENGAPIVTKLGMTSTFFVTTQYLGSDIGMSKQDLRDMVAQGFTVGGHSATHADERHLDKAGLNSEIVKSQALLTKIVGQPVTSFAYPYGAWHENIFPVLRKAGIKIAYQLTDKPISEAAPLLTQRRILMQSNFSGDYTLSLIKQLF